MEINSGCTICPRECGASRSTGNKGYCGGGEKMRIASICIHKGEEPAISGRDGICNVFFAGCNMKCIFCQNFQISRKENSSAYPEYSAEEVADRIIKILDKGIRSVGFVTPGHYIRGIKEIIGILHQKGYFPTIVYNTNGYEKREEIVAMEGLADVYLPDFKYLNSEMAAHYSDAGNYPDVITPSLKEMYRQKGSTLVLDEDGRAITGMVIRHLVLPGGTEDSKNILRWIAGNLSTSVHISLMSQYCPTIHVSSHFLLGRTVTPEEYYDVAATMEKLGFCNGWVQELSSSSHYNPDFSKETPFCN
jgi:putative pyruvate formate lyase activating enzyme